MTGLLRTIVGAKPIRPIDAGAVGLADVQANGWFQPTTGELAPGFRITVGDTVLDVGCGAGGMSEFAAAMGAAVIASDVDAACIAAIREKLGHGRARSFKAFVSDSTPLPVADETATRIICTEVLEHVADPQAVSLWWVLFWAADQEFGAAEAPLLASWSCTWQALIQTSKGDDIRRALDAFMPKSQVIIARKAA